MLVVGKVEEDASIRYGCFSRMTNNDLVRLASAIKRMPRLDCSW
ncbi:hypothetical protein ACLMJV_30170 [Sinorhizobium meliloti]